MTMMEMTYAAAAEVTRLEGLHAEWTTKQRDAIRALDTFRRGMGKAVLAGTSQAKLTSELSRLQVDAQSAEQALAEIEQQQQTAARVVKEARIAELRRGAGEKRAQAAALVAEAKPHFDAIAAIEGVHPYLERSRSIDLDRS